MVSCRSSFVVPENQERLFPWYCLLPSLCPPNSANPHAGLRSLYTSIAQEDLPCGG